ncbi:MAG TPA: single-stranded-DNA-specific exonuclease RecJ [Tepidisphaeraceae bacterium]|nr:single-stranded-DNA-specific exonuclease RecJ [Tepidisphaeraceae bacterium]
MSRAKRWAVAEPHPGAAELAARLRTSTLIAQILLNRGLREAQECQDFLRPSLKCLHDPAKIPNLSRAAQRIGLAIWEKHKIVIYGDYDVDGITATAILWHAIMLLGGTVETYIPHRVDEGYGLNEEALKQLCGSGAQLIVSVDCGVTAVAQAKVVRECGVDLIITDHHEWHDDALPECHAIVHPRLPSQQPAYPNPHLCGAGVAFKLAWGIGQAMNGNTAKVSEPFKAFLVEATALAALGTIADVVPLVGENRILTAFGLSGLKRSNLVGLRALIESAGLTGQKLDSYHVGFLLAPRLNACGRMGHAQLAVEMLTRADLPRAIEIATYLEQQNRERQGIEKHILEEALEQIAELKLDGDDCRAIVLDGAGWHAGVIGIVASRIVDRFNRPTVIIGLNADGVGQGSGRSILGFHLTKALESCADLLIGYGGHEMAAGLKIDATNLEAFRQRFCQYAASVLEPEQLIPELKLDGLAELGQVTAALVNDLQRIGPFGMGNRKPLLVARGLELAAPPRRVGKTGDHLQLYVRQGRSSMKCIAFGYAHMFDQLRAGSVLDVAFEPTLNEYNGSVSVELAVKDLQLTGS